MKKIILGSLIASLALATVPTARAGGWPLAAKVVTGVAAGTIVANALARPYYYAPRYAYAPAYSAYPAYSYPACRSTYYSGAPAVVYRHPVVYRPAVYYRPPAIYVRPPALSISVPFVHVGIGW